MRTEKNTVSCLVIAIITLLSFVAVFLFVPPFPQWSSYHQFADNRSFLFIPNFGNVSSDIFYCIVGILGFSVLHQQWKDNKLHGKEVIVFLILFIGVFLNGFGSAYYHWAPNNESLMWDRIPISIVFMSFLSLTFMERVNFNVGFWSLPLLLVFGVGSVVYWGWSESVGRGDLRFYLFVLFYPLILIYSILFFFRKSYPPLMAYIWILIFYILARIFEYFDHAIYALGGIISGHTLKHVFSAIAAYWFVEILLAKKAK